jgi:uncharacterized protein
MSQENVEIVRRGWEAFESGDLSGLLDTMSDEVVSRRIGLDAATATYHGKEGYLELTADWNEGFAEWSATAEEFIDAGDCVVVRNRQIARGEASGVPVESDFWFVYMVDQGKIVRQDMYASKAQALEAAGLRE